MKLSGILQLYYKARQFLFLHFLLKVVESIIHNQDILSSFLIIGKTKTKQINKKKKLFFF